MPSTEPAVPQKLSHLPSNVEQNPKAESMGQTVSAGDHKEGGDESGYVEEVGALSLTRWRRVWVPCSRCSER